MMLCALLLLPLLLSPDDYVGSTHALIKGEQLTLTAALQHPISRWRVTYNSQPGGWLDFPCCSYDYDVEADGIVRPVDLLSEDMGHCAVCTASGVAEIAGGKKITVAVPLAAIGSPPNGRRITVAFHLWAPTGDYVGARLEEVAVP